MKAVQDLEYHTHVSLSFPTFHSFLMNKYHILTHTHTHTYTFMESRKMVLTNLLAGQQWRSRHTKQIYGHGRGGRRRGGGEWRE